jgi:hypothetical protein
MAEPGAMVVFSLAPLWECALRRHTNLCAVSYDATHIELSIDAFATNNHALLRKIGFGVLTSSAPYIGVGHFGPVGPGGHHDLLGRALPRLLHPWGKTPDANYLSGDE